MATKQAATTTEAAPAVSLGSLSPAPGSRRPKLRVGRGRASGAGKTSNRGHNGEGQRSGRSQKRGFEGGQMPGYRRTPKLRKFERAHVLKWLELNVGELAYLLPADSTELTYEWLVELRLLRHGMDGLRVLGNGELERPITIEAHYVTPGAREKIEAAGGTIKIFGDPAEDSKKRGKKTARKPKAEAKQADDEAKVSSSSKPKSAASPESADDEA